MIKKTFHLALVLCMFLALLSPSLVRAQDRLEILDSSAQAEFPTKLSFSLSARSDVNITDIRLRYRVERASFAEVTSEAFIEFAPATQVDVSWTLEMVRIGGLPPGSGVEYWWLVEDATGNKIETPPSRVQFTDDRYSWRSLTEDKLTIYWYEGDESFAQELMAAAGQALYRLAADTGAHLVNPARIYVYASADDLKGSMIFPQEWTGGVAFTRFDAIVIGIAPANLAWGKRAITHELTHLVVHQVTLNPYSDLPTWLDEGLAVYAEGVMGPEYTSRLQSAVAENNLISVRSLSSPFTAYAEGAILSYAESYSLVDFLIHEYGQARMLELLKTFQQGSGYDEALKEVYGFDIDQLNTLWQEYATRQYQSAAEPAAGKKSGLPRLLIGVLVLLATSLLGLGFGVRYRFRRRSQ